jgi:hypothetical protein
VDFQEHRVQTDIYFTGSPKNQLDSVSLQNSYHKSFYSLDGENRVQEAEKESYRLDTGNVLAPTKPVEASLAVDDESSPLPKNTTSFPP